MNDTLYQFIVGVLDLFLWGGELIGEENLPKRGPAVFIANHLEVTGPIGAICSIPLRLYPWAIGNMMDKDLAPDWLRWDFIERQFHLKPPVSLWIAKALSKITVPMFHTLGCIPVYHERYESMYETLRLSMDVLRQGKFLLVYPEDNVLPADPQTKIRPFQRSFVRLGEMYYKDTGECLEFYPVAIHASGFAKVGKAVAHNPLNPTGWERHRLKDLMEETVGAMYLQLEGGIMSGVLTPERK
jgi:hypothetical protein